MKIIRKRSVTKKSLNMFGLSYFVFKVLHLSYTSVTILHKLIPPWRDQYYQVNMYLYPQVDTYLKPRCTCNMHKMRSRARRIRRHGRARGRLWTELLVETLKWIYRRCYAPPSRGTTGIVGSLVQDPREYCVWWKSMSSVKYSFLYARMLLSDPMEPLSRYPTTFYSFFQLHYGEREC